MLRRSKNIVMALILFLLITSLTSTLHGHIVPVEWTLRGKPAMVLPKTDNALQPASFQRYWASFSNSANLIDENPNSIENETQVKPTLTSPMGTSSKQISSWDASYASSQDASSFPRFVNVVQPLNTKMVHLTARQSTGQDKGFESKQPDVYVSDHTTCVHRTQPDEYKKAVSSKAKFQTGWASGLASYRATPKIKRDRDRDEYICHFKLCQVGVSGIRLIDTVAFPANDYDGED